MPTLAASRVPTLEELLVRAKVAGPVIGPEASEVRRIVERIVHGESHGHGELRPVVGLTTADAWTAMGEIFGATPEEPCIHPGRTLAAAVTAGNFVREVAATGARVALATASPASLFGLHLAVAGLAAAAGGDVVDLGDVGPIRADGRSPRWLRWVNGVATVTDGASMCGTRDGEAAREWLFVVGRPALVVADGPFAEVACAAGLDVVAFAGLPDAALAIIAGRTKGCTIVPMRCDRPSRAYNHVITRIAQGELATAPSEV